MKSNVLELRNLIQGLRLSCQTEGKIPKTIKWYTSFLDRFCTFLERNNHPTDASLLNRSHIREFIRVLKE